jgi:hypothetical protein
MHKLQRVNKNRPKNLMRSINLISFFRRVNKNNQQKMMDLLTFLSLDDLYIKENIHKQIFIK